MELGIGLDERETSRVESMELALKIALELSELGLKKKKKKKKKADFSRARDVASLHSFLGPHIFQNRLRFTEKV